VFVGVGTFLYGFGRSFVGDSRFGSVITGVSMVITDGVLSLGWVRKQRLLFVYNKDTLTAWVRKRRVSLPDLERYIDLITLLSPGDLQVLR
jgi:hypothetical protein